MTQCPVSNIQRQCSLKVAILCGPRRKSLPEAGLITQKDSWTLFKKVKNHALIWRNQECLASSCLPTAKTNNADH